MTDFPSRRGLPTITRRSGSSLVKMRLLFLLTALLSHAMAHNLPVAATHLSYEESTLAEHHLIGEARALAKVTMKEHRRHLQASSLEELNALETLCASVEESFYQNVTCSCVGALLSNTFSMTCEYNEQVCGPLNHVCGRPEIGMSIVNSGIFSATACVKDYANNHRSLQYADTCVSIELRDNDANGGISGCYVQYGGQICSKCETCNDGEGILLDCTNINAEAISTECRGVDSDLDLAGGAGVIAGFLPDFKGFCSQLEDGRDGSVACDCSNSGGGNFDVTCETVEPECIEESGVCGNIKSTVSVMDGRIDSVTSCSDVDAPHDFKETCTRMELCPETDGVCGCSVTYDGKACSRCEVCPSGIAVMLDCSNVSPFAIVDHCQEVRSTTTYEFFPDYKVMVGESGAFGLRSGLVTLIGSMAALAAQL